MQTYFSRYIALIHLGQDKQNNTDDKNLISFEIEKFKKVTQDTKNLF